MHIGRENNLTILRETSVGLFLGSETGEEVLLPNKYVPPRPVIGELIEVFVYRDSEDRVVATTLEPKIQLEQFACLEVVEISDYGVFMDWGLEKDLLVPFSEQMPNMRKGGQYLIYLYLDPKTERLVGSARYRRFLKNEDLDLLEGQAVQLLIGAATDLGYHVVIDQKYGGLLYKNEVFQRLHIGQTEAGYIFKIRESNKIDVRLGQKGYSNIEPNAQIIMDHLNRKGGFLPLSDSSSPEEIYSQLEMSKKTFKKAVGTLYRQKLIALSDKGIQKV